ncbi:rod shape-determining protein MreD [Bacillus sp. SA1-12]|uniref:rod shape-determining protein MreD n=1 Tax=Bacillus sp. SA1-12 TaxID=1455638 RepID=UPI0006264DE0|nr:rod shape-determining protein MreD [Bacillus sp. SA1-12]KKI92306.1 rod shape-determining protein MreD [Bacillus sp. SA1-12]
MRRFILPFLVLFIFISESIFSHLIHIPFALEDQVYIPRFVLITCLFLTVYLNRTHGMIFGLVFGLLYDIVYIEIIGIYLFAYAILAYLVSKAMKILHGNALIVLFLTILSIAILEFYVYGINYLIGSTKMTLYNFTTLRLLPTLALNSIVAILLIYPMKKFLTKIKLEESDD